MLPAGYISTSILLIVNTPIISGTKRFRVKYTKDNVRNYEDTKEEAEGRGKMYLYLLENNLLTKNK